MIEGRRQRARVTIESFAAGGEGVGHLTMGNERRAVFAARTAPGDVIDVDLDPRERPMRALRVVVVEASPRRRVAPCTYADACGGCAWMHLAPAARAEAHASAVEASIGRALGDQAPACVFHAAPAEVGYRTRARLAIEAGRVVRVGFHGAREARVTDVASCLVLDPRLGPALGVLRDAAAGSQGRGEARLALGKNGRPVVSIAWSGEPHARAFATLEGAVAAGVLEGAELRLDGAREAATFGEPVPYTEGPDGRPLRLAPGSFAQANPAVVRALASRARDVVAPQGKRVVELYAGAATLTVALAPGAASYVAVESDTTAVDAARENVAARGLDKVRVVATDAGSFPLPRGVDVVIVDPPRSGLAGSLVGALAAARPGRIMYVSCDAVTLARDARRLLDVGYHPESLDAFDMFPQTDHLELALSFVRAPGAR